MDKQILAVLFTVGLVAGSAFAGNLCLATAQTGTQISGIMSQDTFWTKANSPYLLTGAVGVPPGVTLSIEPGVAVYLYSYYIMVNGTLRAKGESSDPVHFNGGWGGPGTEALTFEPSGSNYSQQTGTGCIIEYAILNETNVSVENVSLRISDDTFIYSPIQIYGASPQVFNNNFFNCGVSMMASIYSPTFASPVIVNNTVSNGEIIFGGGTASAFATISNNSINGGGIGGVGYAYIVDNTITGCDQGLTLNTAAVFGGSEPAYPTVERNLITKNNYGIHINLFARYEPGTLIPLIINNTISQNSVGIYLTESQYGAAPTISYNNFENNTNNIYLDQSTPNNVNATYNWWGTTDNQAINQSIHDYKNDFTLGTVSFIPFLTSPNPQSIPHPNAPLQTPIPTFSTTPTLAPTTPAPTPTIPEFPLKPVLSIVLIMASLAIVSVEKMRQTKRTQKLSSTNKTRRCTAKESTQTLSIFLLSSL